MICTKCKAKNPAGLNFCTECGATFNSRCSACGFENPSVAKFCGQCGTSLERAALDVLAKPIGALSGERRHLTVMFCDLAGSTEIASHLDPEEWRAVIEDYHHAAAQVVVRYGGSVAQYLGDGVLAYFGYPEAHDNDAERAVRAGLAILEAIAPSNQRSSQARLAARVGIDSGAVVVGTGSQKEAAVFGDTPNIAARVQALALPNTLLITDAVHRLVSGLFVVEKRGAQTLKGIERPVPLYRVIQPSGVRGRLQALAASRGLTPFIGRESELRVLMNLWERALEGEGHVALIIGEPGIGKSRLLQRFHELIAETPHTWVEAAAGALYQNTPFYPVTELLRGLLTWRSDEPPEEQLVRLEPSLELAGLELSETVPLIAPLLNLPLPERYPPLALSAEQQRRRLLTTLVEWTLGAARVQPTVIATEDLHWADPSTLELTRLLVEQGARVPLLLLYTARPEFRSAWPPRAHHTQITLNRLSASNVRTMVFEVAAQKALTESTVAAVVERTGGVPLFIEELTRAVLESGDARFRGREIPATLHDSLMARLDRLGPAKEVVQVGAVIGSEFSYELLHAVHPLDETEMQEALRRLADVELIYIHGIAPKASYTFKHALVRDAAYEALLKSRRKELHRLVAQTIDDRFPALKETRPEVLARHWMEAGEISPALNAWARAGTVAEMRHAFSEARESYHQALLLLDLLPASPERDQRELELRRALILVLAVTRGDAAIERIQAAERTASLAEKSGNLKHLAMAVNVRCYSAYVAGDLRIAAALANKALELALREGAPVSLATAHHLQLIARWSRGDLAGVEQHFTAGASLFQHTDFRQQPGGVAVSAFGVASLNALLRGWADVARQRMARVMAIANEHNPYDVAWSGYFAATLNLRLREYERAEALAARSIELSEKNQFPQVAAYSRLTLGQAQVHLGRASEGITLIRRATAGFLEVGNNVSAPHRNLALAVALEQEGRITEALETVRDALQVNPDELMSRPEALRLLGELSLKNADVGLAEANFRYAIALAKETAAKTWQLRATTSLARLLRDTNRCDEARAMLAEIYNWFTEGFDTADLKDAKALLDELSW